MAAIDLRDIRLNYERGGDGETVLLLHGGFSSLGAWQGVATNLRPQHDVIALDSRGQGGSTDGTGPITYGRMTADVIGFLDRLELDQVHLVGWSDGGCVSAQMMIDHPERVRSATLIGTPLHLTDYPPEILTMLKGFLAGLKSGAPEADPYKMGDEYRALSPHPERWTELVRKLSATWLTQPVFTDEMLGQVDVPVLVIGARNDEFLPSSVFERTAGLFTSGQLTWIDEGTHALPMEYPDEVAAAIAGFISDPR